MQKIFRKLLAIVLAAFLSACGFYSFTGASISPDVKTVVVQYFPNRAATIQPTLSQVFTERLKDYFLEQSNLSLEADVGDLNFSGEIVKYEVKPNSLTTPYQDVKEKDRYLKGFKWRGAEQPKTKEDIFIE